MLHSLKCIYNVSVGLGKVHLDMHCFFAMFTVLVHYVVEYQSTKIVEGWGGALHNNTLYLIA